MSDPYDTPCHKPKSLKDKRPETGPMMFGDDWCGVFIRGDAAASYVRALDAAIRERNLEPSARRSLEDMRSLLASCQEGGDEFDAFAVQHAEAWWKCVAPGKPSS